MPEWRGDHLVRSPRRGEDMSSRPRLAVLSSLVAALVVLPVILLAGSPAAIAKKPPRPTPTSTATPSPSPTPSPSLTSPSDSESPSPSASESPPSSATAEPSATTTSTCFVAQATPVTRYTTWVEEVSTEPCPYRLRVFTASSPPELLLANDAWLWWYVPATNGQPVALSYQGFPYTYYA